MDSVRRGRLEPGAWGCGIGKSRPSLTSRGEGPFRRLHLGAGGAHILWGSIPHVDRERALELSCPVVEIIPFNYFSGAPPAPVRLSAVCLLPGGLTSPGHPFPRAGKIARLLSHVCLSPDGETGA